MTSRRLSFRGDGDITDQLGYQPADNSLIICMSTALIIDFGNFLQFRHL